MDEPRCPRCKSDALYRYGVVQGRQKYKCMMCNKQFYFGFPMFNLIVAPPCPKCNSKTSVYKAGEASIKFRCVRRIKCGSYVIVNRSDNNNSNQRG